jgi:hypothetical protein
MSMGRTDLRTVLIGDTRSYTIIYENKFRENFTVSKRGSILLEASCMWHQKDPHFDTM